MYVCRAETEDDAVEQHVTITVGGKNPALQLIRNSIYQKASISLTKTHLFRILLTEMPKKHSQRNSKKQLYQVNTARPQSSLFFSIFFALFTTRTLSILHDTGDSPQPPRIQLNPSHIDVVENSPAAVECFSSSNGQVWYQWTRLDGPLSREAEVSDGILRFAALRQSDAGDYQCLARNEYGDDTRVLRIYVRPQEPAPVPTPQPMPEREVSIEPPNYNGRPGDIVVLRCHNVINVYATLIWSKEGLSYLPAHINVRNGILTITDAVPEDSGRYTCTSTSSSQDQPITEIADVWITPSNNGGGSVENREPPIVQPLEELYTVTQGTDFSLVCEASGNPYPQVKWTKLHEEIGSNVQINGNTLRILNAQPDNRGVYLCSAESNGQTAEQNTVIDIERKLIFHCISFIRHSIVPFLLLLLLYFH